MRIAMFSTKPYDRRSFEAANSGHDIVYLEPRLARETATLAPARRRSASSSTTTFPPRCCRCCTPAERGLVLLRCAGFNNVDLKEAARLGIVVARVPAYSPHAVAEFTIGMLLSLVRGIHRAYQRTRDGNFALEGLLGFDLHGRTAGVIGTGRIGALVARTLAAGFGCRVLAHDVYRDPALEALGVHLHGPAHHCGAVRHHHAALSADAGDAPRHPRRDAGAGQTRADPGEHQPWRADRRRSGDRGAEDRPARRPCASMSTSRKPTSSSRTSPTRS